MTTIETQEPSPSSESADSQYASRAVGVTKIFGSGETEVRALDEVSVGFGPGTFSAIMGPSGSGKSTLLHCLCGLDRVTAGQVFVGDTDLSTQSERQLTLMRRDRIGFIFQSFNLVPVLTARENILLPMMMAGSHHDEGWFDAVVTTLDITDRLHHRPSELSGGQQQRVAVARSLITKPEIVFADEPTGNLDSQSGHEVLGFLRRAVDEFSQTVVMVTHDPIGASTADRIVFLGDGRVAHDMDEPTVDGALAVMKRLSEVS